jgi:hypothetical protein
MAKHEAPISARNVCKNLPDTSSCPARFHNLLRRSSVLRLFAQRKDPIHVRQLPVATALPQRCAHGFSEATCRRSNGSRLRQPSRASGRQRRGRARRATRYSALISSICLATFAAKVLKFSRPLDEPPLAQLPFFVGCRRVNHAVDFLTCHFCRLCSSFHPHACPQGDRKPQLDKPADGFGARCTVLL